MGLVEGLREEFADHDVFLDLMLGLVSVVRRSERWLPEAPPAAPPEAERGLEGEAEQRVMLLLGWISMRQTLMKSLEPVHASHVRAGSPEAPAAPGRRDRGFELLR